MLMKTRDPGPILLAFLLAALFVLAGAPAASAQGSINLAWDDCGLAGHSLKTFLCDTNAGNEELIVSFYPPPGIHQLRARETVVDILFDGPIPPWWSFASGGCRALRLSASSDFTTGFESCADPWLGQGVAAVTYQPNVPLPNMARIRAQCAVAEANAIEVVEGTQYYDFPLLVNNAKTIGAGACGGCDPGNCILIQTVKLIQPAGVGDYFLGSVADHGFVTWQCPGS